MKYKKYCKRAKDCNSILEINVKEVTCFKGRKIRKIDCIEIHGKMSFIAGEGYKVENWLSYVFNYHCDGQVFIFIFP